MRGLFYLVLQGGKSEAWVKAIIELGQGGQFIVGVVLNINPTDKSLDSPLQANHDFKPQRLYI